MGSTLDLSFGVDGRIASIEVGNRIERGQVVGLQETSELKLAILTYKPI